MSRVDFSERINSNISKEALLKKSSDRMSTFRLTEFLAGSALCYFCFRYLNAAAGWGAIILTLAVFIILVKQHGVIKRALEWERCMNTVNQEYLDRINGSWTGFKDNGQEFADPDHPYTGDLDIFGKQSLFQAINTGKTYYGRTMLKERLIRPIKDPEQIKRYQNSVREMAGKIDFCQSLQCEAMQSRQTGSDPHDFIAYAEDQNPLFKNKQWENPFYILPAATVLSIAFASLGLLIPSGVPVLLCAVQIIIMLFSNKKLNPIFSSVGKFKDEIMTFGNMIKRIEDEDFKDPVLLELKGRLSGGSKKTSRHLKKMVNIAEAMDIRYSPMLRFLLNMLFLWDYHCVFAINEWKKQNGSLIKRWIESTGEFEMLSSLAVPLVAHPDWTFPLFTATGSGVTAEELGHVLIPDEKRVCNDIAIKNQILVITGSNMSGKTTLLRTIGINLVLAYTGAPVCAKAMTCSIMDIYTSMRINDDLNSGISTFYAELLRMKMIIDRSKNRDSMIFLIDEIFRGTNSTDRTVGAVKVLKALNKSWIIGLISTHDFELCDLENEDRARVRNYHFTESYKGNSIYFDYKLYSGRSETTNARFLMKMVGIE